jgi:hypothetical protein
MNTLNGTTFIALNAAAYAEMPADVAAYVKEQAKERRIRKAMVSIVKDGKDNMWADEGATVRAFMGGASASVRMASEDTLGGGDNMSIGRYTAPVGAWIVSGKWFMGKWSMTIYHVVPRVGEIAAPAVPVISAPEPTEDFETMYGAPLAIAAPAVPEMPASVRDAAYRIDPEMPIETAVYPAAYVDLETEIGLTFFRSRYTRSQNAYCSPINCAIPASHTGNPDVYEIPADTWVIVTNKETRKSVLRYAFPNPEWE